MKELLNQEELLRSSVVANNRMNRERGCTGGNSYQKDLSFNAVEFLAKRLATNESVAWLDICCGSGKALIEVAALFAGENFQNKLQIIGIDLAGMFGEFPAGFQHLNLLQTTIEDYEAQAEFDLITCVHGLHYIGNKLALIQKAAGWLKADGVFAANLDLKNLKLAERQSSRAIIAFLRKQGFSFDGRKHLLECAGKKEFDVPFEYIGADDAAGANYTGQAAVTSYYRFRF